MVNITGRRFTTIAASANEVYKVTLSTGNGAVDMINNTGGDIFVSETNDFTESASGSAYLIIPSGGCYNGLRPYSDTLYIRAAFSGTISVALKHINA